MISAEPVEWRDTVGTGKLKQMSLKDDEFSGDVQGEWGISTMR